ncbi:hypothetical protein [Nitrincola iocasae]|uniref:CheW-like domain-containing protein n=1 Tax=Nitrincola iocasae TaxID=2614693 RepID=A0A5J6LI02_9GAMM|nr:hypothetical protein [Nitrincola iocasae]QEW08128.1 hypothetical protein F5I99_17410 [Nitrincola iocasae]
MSSPLPVVVFSHEGSLFGLEAIRVAGRGMIDAQISSIVPFSVLYSDVANETLLTDPVSQWLKLRGKTADWLLGLSADADLIELQPADIHPLPEIMAQRSHFKPLKALGFYQQRVIALLDADALEGYYRQTSRI